MNILNKPRSGYWSGICSGCAQTKELVLETNWCDACIEKGSVTPEPPKGAFPCWDLSALPLPSCYEDNTLRKPKVQIETLGSILSIVRRSPQYIVRYIVEQNAGLTWEQSPEIPFNMPTEERAREHMKGAMLRHPNYLHRVSCFQMTDEEFETQEHTQKLKTICDDILRQVVCHCGCYRHHGVDWMPEGSGEGLSVAVEILRKAGL